MSGFEVIPKMYRISHEKGRIIKNPNSFDKFSQSISKSIMTEILSYSMEQACKF